MRLAEIGVARGCQKRFDRHSLQIGSSKRGGEGMANGRGREKQASCEDCFFRRNHLCALSDEAPCATFRPAHPEGLRPPSQLRFVFRQERRLQVAWAFPSANEQVALHA
jgi:hypothetical protein